MRYILHNSKLIDKIINLDTNNLNIEIITSTNDNLFEDKTFISYLKSNTSFENNENYLDCKIKELTEQEALNFIKSINDKYLVDLNMDGTISIHLETSDIRINIFNENIKPFRDWQWNEQFKKWVQTSTKLNEVIFESEWNEEKQKWISECKVNPNRLFRAFQVWKVEEKSNSSVFSKACSNTEYMIKTMQEETHGFTFVNELVTSTEDNQVIFPLISKHYVLIDLAPLVVITYSETNSETLVESVYKTHPQSTSRTIHELFRLIIEWAYSYTEFNNTEPMAKLSHNILQALQMPKAVRDDIMAIRPQPVARFISGDSNALEEYDTDTPMPESFKLWISDMYYFFRSRTVELPLNIDENNLPELYPM